MINTKIKKVLAGCIAGVSLVGLNYFISAFNNNSNENIATIEERNVDKPQVDNKNNEENIIANDDSNIESNNKNNVEKEKQVVTEENTGINNRTSTTDTTSKEDKEVQTNTNETNESTTNKENNKNNKNETFTDIVLDYNNGNYVPQKGENNTTIEKEPESNTNTEIKDESNTTTDNVDSSAYIAEIEQLIFQKVNEERVAAGLSPLNYNTTMEHYGRLKSKDMGDRGYFDHANPEGEYITSQMKADGVSYKAWGENIAYISGMSGNSTLADRFMTNWMNSSGHRANILSTNFTSMGVGVYKIGNTYYATQEFYR